MRPCLRPSCRQRLSPPLSLSLRQLDVSRWMVAIYFSPPAACNQLAVQSPSHSFISITLYLANNRANWNALGLGMSVHNEAGKYRP